MTVDFEQIASRPSEFGIALRAKLAESAKVPEKSLRLIGLRSGSIIAEFLVLPSVVDDPFAPGLDSLQTTERLRIAVGRKSADLCALTGAPLEGCKVEFTHLGVATPSVRPMPKQRPQQQEEAQGQSGKSSNSVAVAVVVSGFCLLKLALWCYLGRSGKKKQEPYASAIDVDNNVESQVTSSMEEGKGLEEKKLHFDEKTSMEQENDNASTLAPSSDKQSEPSNQGDVETTSQASLVILKALSEGNV
jgi:hypothetical protein